jgi:hypothetical protein
VPCPQYGGNPSRCCRRTGWRSSGVRVIACRHHRARGLLDSFDEIPTRKVAVALVVQIDPVAVFGRAVALELADDPRPVPGSSPLAEPRAKRPKLGLDVGLAGGVPGLHDVHTLAHRHAVESQIKVAKLPVAARPAATPPLTPPVEWLSDAASHSSCMRPSIPTALRRSRDSPFDGAGGTVGSRSSALTFSECSTLMSAEPSSTSTIVPLSYPPRPDDWGEGL